MKIGSMPGLTATASIYRTSGRYRTAGGPKDTVGGTAVLPQLPIGFCMADCDSSYADDPFLASVCKLRCFDQEGGGGGGTGGGGGNGGHWLALECRRCKAACRKMPPSKRDECNDNCADFC